MVVLVLHQEDESLLYKFQKKLISQIYIDSTDKELLVYENYPLWITLPQLIYEESQNETTFLKKISSEIKKLQINTKELLFKEISKEKKYYYYPVIIELNSSTHINTELIIFYSNKKTTLPKIENVVLSQKIFRLGLTCKPTENSIALTSFVWKKIT